MTQATLDRPASAGTTGDSKTPVLRTASDPLPAQSKAAAVCIDWISVVFPIPLQYHKERGPGEYVNELLTDQLDTCITAAEPRDNGTWGYPQALTINGGAVLAWNNSKPEMGVYLSIPGGAIASFKSVETETVPQFLSYLQSIGGRCTRLDLAFDDFSGAVAINRIEDYLHKHQVVTRWRDFIPEHKFSIETGEEKAAIVMMGSRKSACYGRIYDKRLEQMQVKHADGADLPAHWVRVELELKGDKADAAASMVTKTDEADLVQRLCGYLYSVIRFVEPDLADTNKRRWSTSDWWLTFLHQAAKEPLTVPKPLRTIEKTRNWIIDQCEQAMAVITLAAGDGVLKAGRDELWKLVQQGQARMNAENRKLLERHFAAIRGRQDKLPLRR